VYLRIKRAFDPLYALPVSSSFILSKSHRRSDRGVSRSFLVSTNLGFQPYSVRPNECLFPCERTPLFSLSSTKQKCYPRLTTTLQCSKVHRKELSFPTLCCLVLPFCLRKCHGSAALSRFFVATCLRCLPARSPPRVWSFILLRFLRCKVILRFLWCRMIYAL